MCIHWQGSTRMARESLVDSVIFIYCSITRVWIVITHSARIPNTCQCISAYSSFHLEVIGRQRFGGGCCIRLILHNPLMYTTDYAGIANRLFLISVCFDIGTDNDCDWFCGGDTNKPVSGYHPRAHKYPLFPPHLSLSSFLPSSTLPHLPPHIPYQYPTTPTPALAPTQHHQHPTSLTPDITWSKP